MKTMKPPTYINDNANLPNVIGKQKPNTVLTRISLLSSNVNIFNKNQKFWKKICFPLRSLLFSNKSASRCFPTLLRTVDRTILKFLDIIFYPSPAIFILISELCSCALTKKSQIERIQSFLTVLNKSCN